MLLLFKRNVGIVGVVGVLLQKSHAHHLRRFNYELLVIGENVCADKLYNLHQLVFLLKYIGYLLTQLHKVRADILGVIICKVGNVLAVAVVPVDSGVVARISKRLVQRPEAPYKALGVLRYRLGEIRALRRNRTDYGNAALAAVERFDIACALVELGKSGGQVCGEALLGGHFLKASRNFTQSLCPARGRVRHNSNMVAHVAVVFRKRDTRINRSLARGNGHIGGICDKHRSVGQRSVGFGVDKLGELLKNLSHFVAALAAADVYDNIGVAPFCKLVLGHGFARAEAAGDCSRAALCNGYNGINYALTRDKRSAYRQALCCRARALDRPPLNHCEGKLRAVL